VLSGDGWAALGAHIRMGSRSSPRPSVMSTRPGRLVHANPWEVRGDQFPT
jgi:hypothetical protein